MSPPAPVAPDSDPTGDPLTRPDPQVLAVLHRVAVTLAVEAGVVIRTERPAEVVASATKSSDTDVVTAMDTRSETLLRERLAQLRPGDGIVGEEGRDTPSQTGITWVVDPIDGTVNYFYDLPAYAVSVAAVVGDPRRDGAWRPVAAAVAAPALGTVFGARVGGGAWQSRIDGSQVTSLTVNAVVDPTTALVGTGFGYRPERRRHQAEVLTRVLPRVRDIRRIGSAAVDLCLVASGRLDAYYEIGVQAWDIAAGWLVVTEAGGVVRGPGGGAPTDALVLAGGRPLVEALAELVAGTTDATG